MRKVNLVTSDELIDFFISRFIEPVDRLRASACLFDFLPFADDSLVDISWYDKELYDECLHNKAANKIVREFMRIHGVTEITVVH